MTFVITTILQSVEWWAKIYCWNGNSENHVTLNCQNVHTYPSCLLPPFKNTNHKFILCLQPYDFWTSNLSAEFGYCLQVPLEIFIWSINLAHQFRHTSSTSLPWNNAPILSDETGSSDTSCNAWFSSPSIICIFLCILYTNFLVICIFFVYLKVIFQIQ